MAETLPVDFNQPMGLYATARCLVLPGAVLPLHIDDPAQAVMIEQALGERGLLAMAVYKARREPTTAGVRPVREHVCIGQITRHEPLPGGRHNVLVRGLCRARIRREVAGQAYRQVLLAPTEPEPGQGPMEIDLDEPRKRIDRLLEDPVLERLAAVQAVNRWRSADVPTPVLLDVTMLSVGPRSELCYAMLAEPDVHGRAELVEHHLHQTRHTLELAQRMELPRGPRDLPLN